MRCFVVHLFLKLTISTVVIAGLKHVPTDITARLGEDVRLKCSTESLDSVDWTYRREEGQPYRPIFIGRTRGGGDKSSSYKTNKRIHVDFDIPSGQYDLIIRNVTQTDEGEYMCFDISDPESPASAKLLILITGEVKTEFCSYDVAAAAGTEVKLNFTTTQSHSIHLEHRSIYKSYPLHVFRDGRIVNDYYVLSRRFSVDVSAGVWSLVIKDIEMSDAGTYIFSEDNSLGKQNVLELIVIESGNAINGEKCEEKNCSVRFAGNCPPRLEWRQLTDGENGGMKILRSTMTTSDSAIITSTRIEDGDQELSSLLCCVVMETFSEEHANQRSFLTVHHLSSCKENAAVNRLSVALYLAVTIISFAAFALVLLIWLIKRRSLRCSGQQNPDDIATPARLNCRETSTPVVVLDKRETPVKQRLVNDGTAIGSDANGREAPGSSIRKRTQCNASGWNFHEDSANSRGDKSDQEAKAKRKLALDNSF